MYVCMAVSSITQKVVGWFSRNLEICRICGPQKSLSNFGSDGLGMRHAWTTVEYQDKPCNRNHIKHGVKGKDHARTDQTCYDAI